MKRNLRYVLLLVLLAFTTETALSQATGFRELHKVKRKETIFGIARDYGITVDELMNANPEMRQADYKLKKGEFVRIPYSSGDQPSARASRDTYGTAGAAPAGGSRPSGSSDLRKRPIRLGVMLPLHDVNGDGRRMVEYYRGVLMACDSLRRTGISVDVHAWNTAEDSDIRPILREEAARQCDLIIGPLYSKQMKLLSEFVQANDIRLLIPFSITAPELFTNRNIFQVYQTPNGFNEAVISRFTERFQGYHPVFIDCRDSTSTKGVFTASLRHRLEARHVDYNLTSLVSSEENFSKAFSRQQPNVVILNTGRSPELNVAMAKLNGLCATDPKVSITLFGYNEWLMYTKYQLENFYKYNAYIPSTYYYNPLAPQTSRLEQKYRWNFHTEMQQSLPRFALTGFDQAMFFLRGLYLYGKNFTGAKGTVNLTPVQTPLHFERLGNGGLQNRSLVFIHYQPNHRVETVSY